MIKNFIVITSINAPTRAVKKFAALLDYKTIVVGDKKTPAGWAYKNVGYLSLQNQIASYAAFCKLLPVNHYSRKMIGYLFAINSGATMIVDTDDDNIPLSNFAVPNFDGTYDCVYSNMPLNIYSLFINQSTNNLIWPRGYPLELITAKNKITSSKNIVRVGIWQGLANGDPDVDAIYRMTNGSIDIAFKKRSPVVLKNKTWCPFNSQNTYFRHECFPLLYLPSTVTFRFTDILRGIIAQPILWKFGYSLGFTQATVFQARNKHTLLKDFIDEVPMYLHAKDLISLVGDEVKKSSSCNDALMRCYSTLHKLSIVKKEELALLKAWLRFF
ncbi:MAG: STELLO glycosyltransferase family protein [Methylacidiphilales bacterium]|nr:STELLO glycosyltransferase family protein [Candidatus Methylacidiphilales bacterium]